MFSYVSSKKTLKSRPSRQSLRIKVNADAAEDETVEDRIYLGFGVIVWALSLVHFI